MKKILFSIAALMVVAVTVFTFSSCNKNEDEVGGILVYQFGAKASNISDVTAWSQINQAYETEFKKLSGTTSVADGIIKYPYGSSSSTYNSQILSACSAAEAYIQANVKLSGWGNCTYHVYCVNSDKEIYEKKWGE